MVHHDHVFNAYLHPLTMVSCIVYNFMWHVSYRSRVSYIMYHVSCIIYRNHVSSINYDVSCIMYHVISCIMYHVSVSCIIYQYHVCWFNSLVVWCSLPLAIMAWHGCAGISYGYLDPCNVSCSTPTDIAKYRDGTNEGLVVFDRLYGRVSRKYCCCWWLLLLLFVVV
jgi:hypothetical protein